MIVPVSPARNAPITVEEQETAELARVGAANGCLIFDGPGIKARLDPGQAGFGSPSWSLLCELHLEVVVIALTRR
jgi:hypothetical protein